MRRPRHVFNGGDQRAAQLPTGPSRPLQPSAGRPGQPSAGPTLSASHWAFSNRLAAYTATTWPSPPLQPSAWRPCQPPAWWPCLDLPYTDSSQVRCVRRGGGGEGRPVMDSEGGKFSSSFIVNWGKALASYLVLMTAWVWNLRGASSSGSELHAESVGLNSEVKCLL